MKPAKSPGIEKKAFRGQWRKDEKAQEIPDNNMFIVFPCIMAATFLCALDSTIITTALPSISADLQMDSAEYSWVGVAYLLTSCALIPVVSKVGTIVGEKLIFIVGILCFCLGSGLCAGAKSGFWLCIARGVQGLGGGTIMSSVQIVISLITELSNRGLYSGLIGSVWGIASVLGPLLGGAITEHANWRWCFWINLPISAVVMAALCYFLKLSPRERPNWKQVLIQFDYVGLVSILIGSVCLILGFSIASNSGWQNPAVIALVVVGGVVTIFFGVWETYTTSSAIIPPRLFKTLTTTSILIGNLFHSIGYLASCYYLPVFFQVADGTGPLESGVRLLPYTLGASVVSIVCGLLVARFHKYRIMIWLSWAIQVLGYGLMTTLRNDSNTAKQILYILVASLGVGCLFQVPLLAMQSSLPIVDVSTGTGAYVFVRSLGGCIAISVSGTIVSNVSKKKLQNIPNAGSLAGLSTENLTDIKNIEPESLKVQVQAAYSEAIAKIFIMVVVLAGCGLISSLFIKRYEMRTNTVKKGEQKNVEKTEDENTKQEEHTEQDEPTEKDEHTAQDSKKDMNLVSSNESSTIAYSDGKAHSDGKESN
ncbi:hypothetical protein E3P92_04014 [Wallemia ichthyophaga]|nr:hypothetical protein E3P91_04024 [Wallemia ichthyophaga]TIB07533.1 hypothetical protein E3P92_04014 [Wallemia ichthyophaga]TIB58206.1 hypothetical protein E3P78_03996 [Wallemia ichthyophaga]